LILVSVFAPLMAQWNTDRILTIGRNALYFEDYVLSIQYFNQVIKIRPFQAEPYLYRGIAKLQLGDFQGAESDIDDAVIRNPFLPEAFYARGFTRMRLGRYEEAEKDFTKAIEFSPSSRHLLLSRMDARERTGDFSGAINDLETLLKMNPRAHELFFEKGRIQLAMKDTIAAENSFNQFINADSISPAGWSARALLRIQKKDYDGAYQDYSKAIKLNSKNVGDYINRGIINVEANRFMEALNDYDTAVKLDPGNILVYLNRGVLRANLGDDNNALNDFKKVLDYDSTLVEARYSKAMLELKLRNYRVAIADYQKVIDKHPLFMPAYLGVAEAYAGLNNTREAFRFRQKASDMERSKEYREKLKQNLEAKNRIAEQSLKTSTAQRTQQFNRFATRNINEAEYESKYNNERRGAVQKKLVDVVNEKNFVLSYYSKPDAIRRTNLFHLMVEQYNRKRVLGAELKITSVEIPLNNELIDKHFETINKISSTLLQQDQNPDLYFYRGIEYALVQDYSSSIEDLNRAVSLKSDFVLAFFARANIRYKYVDYLRNANKEASSEMKSKYAENEYKFDVELIMRDFDKVIELQPDFPFSYYNKANILVSIKDYQSAISLYNKAIEVDGDFAEAYFNRGLTYIFIGDDARGLVDLSKAGELGIYSAYSLIQQFK
jgi:tetratricopeptide (TPR) repeat protein